MSLSWCTFRVLTHICEYNRSLQIRNWKKAALHFHLHISAVHMKGTCQKQLYFSGNGNITNCKLWPWSFLISEKLRKAIERRLFLRLITHTGQPCSRVLFSTRYWSRCFRSCLGKISLRTWSCCTHHWPPVFIHNRGSIEHTASNTTARPHNTSPYNSEAVDSYFNICLKCKTSNLSKVLCRLFSSSYCYGQPAWQIMSSQPSWSCTAEMLGEEKDVKQEN